MSKTKIYYFAYGSNLSQKQMFARCPHAVLVGKARVQNYKFAITGYSSRWRGGVATIVSKRGSEVWGAIYELDPDCLVRLDGFEGVKYRAYVRKIITCRYANNKKCLATTYVREPRRLTHWSAKYRNIILDSARKLNLPADYIVSLHQSLR